MVFKYIDFNIIIDIEMTRCNYLDITLDIANSCYMPYRKENFSIRYISNHPTIIRKNLPKMIEKRLKRLPTNPQIFNNAKHSYQAALHQFNFKHNFNMKTKQPCRQKEKKTNKKNHVFQSSILPIS